MSTCLTSAGRTYSLDLDIVKSPSTSSRSSQSSPSSTLSESSNSPLTITTRKPRTPRKRPNQTYTEAAALLSTIYPNIFSTKNLRKLCKRTKSYDSFVESPELLPTFPAFDNAGFLLYEGIPEKPISLSVAKHVDAYEKTCRSPIENEFQMNSPSQCTEYDDDFDAESILDEEIEGGIDSIMGNLSVDNDCYDEANDQKPQSAGYYANLMGLGLGGMFEFAFVLPNVRALRRVDDGEWWRAPTVEVLNITPKFKPAEKKKKKKKKVEEIARASKESEQSQGPNEASYPVENQRQKLGLKLNHEEVLDEWSPRGSPYAEDFSPESPADAIARLSQIDLSPDWRQGEENGGVREASVLRYREKRRTRLFSKKIRYQVRKMNADRRPRMKGRFVRRPSLLQELER
ncbi:protein CHLOROPLAST IMPORT APPARATUS 2-like isoform X2 [Aristolochia californica]|uniref:protein CHLOROPLAST IMPORT APPARATUS 2-like isoform X2 n=1 Tax=Aristolochia californica TaxID=171875 RepID=UPI0035E34638